MKRSFAITFYILVFFIVSVAGAHAHGGAPIEDDTCTRRLNHSLIHFSLYQPQVDDETEFCSDIPATGSAFLVIDLVDFELRKAPMSLQILGRTADGDETLVLKLGPKLYPQGVIESKPFFAKPGTYVAIVKRGDDHTMHSHFSVRVGQDTASFIQKNPFFILIFGIAIFALAAPLRRLWQRRANT